MTLEKQSTLPASHRLKSKYRYVTNLKLRSILSPHNYNEKSVFSRQQIYTVVSAVKFELINNDLPWEIFYHILSILVDFSYSFSSFSSYYFRHPISVFSPSVFGLFSCLP